MDEFMKFMLLSGALKNIENSKPSNNNETITNDNFIVPSNDSSEANQSKKYFTFTESKKEHIKYNPQSQASNNLVCPECFSKVKCTEKFCSECGCPIEYIKSNQESKSSNNLLCPECFSTVQDNEQFCPECGCPIDIILNHQNKKIETLKNNINNNYPLKSLLELYDSIIIFDTETTGLDYKNDRIIELSAIKITCRNSSLYIENKIDSLIELPPSIKISDKITEITGITNSDIMKYGNPPYQIFISFIKMFENQKTLIVAYNAQFDLCFLLNALQRESLSISLNGIDFLDALTVFKDRRSYPHKLKDAISAYNLDYKVKNTHKSIDDTLALLEVLKAMDNECNDLDKYINIFGYNPKYGVQGSCISKIKYLSQPYNGYKKIYQ